MKIIEATDRIPNLIDRLLEVWESSVRATHLFLSDGEIKSIKEYVPQALKGIAHLMIAEDDAGRPMAFMGVEDGTLEMLFISPEESGKGLGKRLIQYGIESYGVKRLAVNEQNPQAKGFYEHMGFQVYKRTDYDEQGNPYPLLYMSLAQKPWENLSSERNQMNTPALETERLILRKFTEQDMEALFHSLYTVFESDIQQKELHYSEEIHIRHKYAVCDKTRLQEIQLNIVSNAIKYTPRG